MSKRQDRKALHFAATTLRDELKSRCERNGFKSRERLRIVQSYTDGWYVLLGKTADRKFGLHLWLDRYPDTEERRFYFGFYTCKPVDLKRLQSTLPSHLQPVRALNKKDFKKFKERDWRLHPPLSKHEFAKPISEDYYGRNCFYGMYERNRSRTKADINRSVKRAADFFSEVMWVLTPTRKAQQVNAVYPHLERSVVRKHLVRERSPELAKACKQRDGFRCQVCRMTFEETYGELGRECAESHHLHPLSRAKANAKTRLEDLVTVCANCHRMLHLMRGREHDLAELQRIIKAQK
jgi:5-methylcytosine-specific restriction endonuclease McrA